MRGRREEWQCRRTACISRVEADKEKQAPWIRNKITISDGMKGKGSKGRINNHGCRARGSKIRPKIAAAYISTSQRSYPPRSESFKSTTTKDGLLGPRGKVSPYGTRLSTSTMPKADLRQKGQLRSAWKLGLSRRSPTHT